MNYLADVKVGDEIVINRGRDVWELAKVTRTTKTQVVAGKDRFLRSGREVGADIWSRDYAYPATPEWRARFEQSQREQHHKSLWDEILNYFYKTSWRQSNVGKLERIAAILREDDTPNVEA